MHEHLIIVVIVAVVIDVVVVVVVVIAAVVDVVVVVVVDAAIGEIVVEVRRLAVVQGIMALWPGDGRGLTASLLHHGCMIPMLAIKFFARGAPCPDFLVSLHPFDWIECALPMAT